MRRVLLAVGLITLVITFFQLFTTRFSNNTLFAAGLTVFFVGYGIFFERLKKIRWLNISILIGFLFLSGLAVFIAVYGQRDNVTYDEDAVIVLGAGLRGENVSNALKRRLDKAVAYHAQNPDAIIVVTGGQGANEIVTEAWAMEQYLLASGIPADQIVKEEQAASTYENMLYSKNILDNRYNGSYIAVIITNDFHMYRSTQMARRAGIVFTCYHAGTPWYTLPTSYARECAAVIKFWLIKR